MKTCDNLQWNCHIREDYCQKSGMLSSYKINVPYAYCQFPVSFHLRNHIVLTSNLIQNVAHLCRSSWNVTW